jgi:two-component system CAI-1 autoinducer sensor kinase/phosphatase CqsS
MLAAAAILSLTSYYFIWTKLFPNDYESFLIRAIGSALCIPLLFYDRYRDIHDRVLRWYWPATLTYVLPFVFGYMLAQNAARADALGETNLVWPLQNVVALVIFMMLVNDGLIATSLWAIATLLILATVVLEVTDPNWAELSRVYLEPMPLYGFILVVGSLANRNREIIDQEKLAAVAAVGSTIAHELRTPCLGIKALAEGIQSYLPILVRGYEAAVTNGLVNRDIRGRHVDALTHSLARIKDETDYANRVIDMLLINSSDQPLRGLEFDTISAATCVRNAVERYPFSSAKEKERLALCIVEDFSITAPEVLLVHVLFNLLKNAIYYVEKSGGGQITIRVSRDTREVVIEDTGTGISSENLPRIFDRFFTTTDTGHGSGIGLSFCRMVMDGIGGTIECESQPNEFTKFTLTFPEAAYG